MEKTRKIDKLLKEFKANQWLFPSSHSDERIVSKDFSFNTYLNDERDYITISIEKGKHSIEIIFRDNKWSVRHPLGISVTEKKVEEYLNIIKKHFSKSLSKLEEQRIIDIKTMRGTIKALKKKLSILENK